MRLVLDPRVGRLSRRLPAGRLLAGVEIALLLLLGFQCARLLWTAITPVGPLGDWRVARARAASPAILATFDPFFRLKAGGGGPVVVTGLDLKLFGVRADQATGRGSAIIGLPDGSQTSVAVGEEIAPGVTLRAVAFDGVTIARGGAEEKLFLDQSMPASTIAPQATGTIAAGGVAPAALLADTQLVARVANGAVTGFVARPRGSGKSFAAAGLEPGDVIVSINGERLADAAAADRLAGRLEQRSEALIAVERGGQVMPLRVKIAQ